MNTRFVSFFLFVLAIAMTGCRFESRSIKEDRTNLLLRFWTQQFRLYHELSDERAESLKAVIEAVRNTAEPDIVRELDVTGDWNSRAKKVLVDAWGRPFEYRYEHRNAGTLWVVVVSVGADGTLGTADDLTGEIQVEPAL